MAKIVIQHPLLLCYVNVLKDAFLYYSLYLARSGFLTPFSISGQQLFPPITAIIISILNELDNHSHFDSMKHSKGYISRGRR